MTFKPRTWFPIAAVLAALNVAAVWFAAAPGEPAHATLHAGLGVAFALWAQRLRQRLHEGTHPPPQESFDLEVDELRQQLAEAEERLDFTERMLVQLREPERVERRRPEDAD